MSDDFDQDKQGNSYAHTQDHNARIEQLLESGELPDDPAEIEALLGAETLDKTSSDDPAGSGDEASGTDDPPKQDDTSGTETDETGTDTGDGGEEPGTGEDPASTAAKPDDGETSTPEGSGESRQETGDDGTGTSEGDDKPEGVATRNGKNVIPYGVLESERRANKELKQQLKARDEELKRLRSADQPPSSGDQQSAKAALDQAEQQQQSLFDRYGIDKTALPMNEDGSLNLDSLRDEYPDEFVNILQAQNQLISGLSKQVDELTKTSRQLTEREEALLQESLQDAIDMTPELAAAQAKGGRRWAIAQSIDNTLREDEEWENVPIRIRFAEVAHLMKGGDPRTPTDVEKALISPPRESGQPPKEPGQDKGKAGDPRTEADRKLAENSESTAPQTHSDLPAGSAPAQSGLDNLDTMDPLQIEEAMERMGSDEFLNRMLR